MTKRKHDNGAMRSRRAAGFAAMMAGWKRSGGYDLSRTSKHHKQCYLSPDHAARARRRHAHRKRSRMMNHTQRRYPTRGNLFRITGEQP